MSTKALTLSASDKSLAQQEAEDAEALLAEILDLPCETQEDLEFAAGALAEVKGKYNHLKEMLDKVVNPIELGLREVRSWFKPGLDFYTKCEKLLKHKIEEGHDRAFEKQREALQLAAAASMAGDTEAAATAMEEAEQFEVRPIPGLSIRNTWDYEIVDFKKLPDEYKLADDKKIRAVIRAHKGVVNIPGIKPVRKGSVSSKSK